MKWYEICMGWLTCGTLFHLHYDFNHFDQSPYFSRLPLTRHHMKHGTLEKPVHCKSLNKIQIVWWKKERKIQSKMVKTCNKKRGYGVPNACGLLCKANTHHGIFFSTYITGKSINTKRKTQLSPLPSFTEHDPVGVYIRHSRRHTKRLPMALN